MSAFHGGKKKKPRWRGSGFSNLRPTLLMGRWAFGKRSFLLFFGRTCASLPRTTWGFFSSASSDLHGVRFSELHSSSALPTFLHHGLPLPVLPSSSGPGHGGRNSALQYWKSVCVRMCVCVCVASRRRDWPWLGPLRPHCSSWQDRSWELFNSRRIGGSASHRHPISTHTHTHTHLCIPRYGTARTALRVCLR